ncbi:ABC transporter permease [Microbacterium saperdae]|uniref:Peptide/nickel transport system permease protein n=1 Tax=Microbacterium saperdae TaxID=69368 RepID=A0A543B9W4_9MICO|nr:ABC transporter permease [Microbacterium saperdae]TQL81639.1 peptide/nickel transport system permease protein [Microbacterium saperdae]GGM33600.1 ABC transporter permease [Microbacterium saperdae]
MVLQTAKGEALTIVRGPRARRRRSSRRIHGQLALAVALLVLIVGATLLAPWIAPHDPLAADGALKYLPVGSPDHLLGTDEQGRDILSRLLYGGQTSLLIAIAAVAASTVLGSVLALIAGFSNDNIAGVIMRTIDILFAFPVIIAAVALAAILGPGTTVVIAAIVFSATPYVARIVFAEVKLQRGKDYVEAALSLGAGFWSVLFREVLPNVAAPIFIYASGLVGIMIVFSSSLSALGIGVQPPTPDWGRMISEGAKVIISGNIVPALLPGLVVLLVALAFNWLGDGLRDVLDPHRRRIRS